MKTPTSQHVPLDCTRPLAQLTTPVNTNKTNATTPRSPASPGLSDNTRLCFLASLGRTRLDGHPSGDPSGADMIAAERSQQRWQARIGRLPARVRRSAGAQSRLDEQRRDRHAALLGELAKLAVLVLGQRDR
jgi:hypothetical protein